MQLVVVLTFMVKVVGLDAPDTNKFYDNHIHQQQDPHYTWQKVFALQHPPAVPPGAPHPPGGGQSCGVLTTWHI